MAGWQAFTKRLQEILFGIPGVRLVVRAMQGYIGHQSANQAGSVAFSSVLAMFPLLILVSAAAGSLAVPVTPRPWRAA